MKFLKADRLSIFFFSLALPLLSLQAIVTTSSHETEPKETLLNDAPKVDPSPLTGNIRIRGRQMLVDGKPFVMKGVCYSPVPRGGTYPEDLLTTNPSEADLAIIEKDFQMMHEAGVNTIRTYEPMLDPRILKLLQKYELRTIVPVLNYYGASFEKVTAILLALKDEPTTLIWEVGNEWNLNYFYDPSSDPDHIKEDQAVTLLENAAHYIRLMDTTHPISTVMGDLPTDVQFWDSLNFKGIDIYGINVYDGLTFGDRLARWTYVSNKPLYISEFGADAYNANIKSEDDASQAFATKSLIKEIQHNLSAKNPDNVLIGGDIFEWTDEWWKPDSKSPDTHDAGNILKVNGGPYPDHVFNEKWFGITDIDRHPRPAYYALKKLYTRF